MNEWNGTERSPPPSPPHLVDGKQSWIVYVVRHKKGEEKEWTNKREQKRGGFGEQTKKVDFFFRQRRVNSARSRGGAGEFRRGMGESFAAKKNPRS